MDETLAKMETLRAKMDTLIVPMETLIVLLYAPKRSYCMHRNIKRNGFPLRTRLRIALVWSSLVCMHASWGGICTSLLWQSAVDVCCRLVPVPWVTQSGSSHLYAGKDHSGVCNSELLLVAVVTVTTIVDPVLSLCCLID